MTLSTAKKYAARIAAEIKPFCSRIEIAGSIRRQCAVVHDIDLVVIPSDQSGLRSRVKRNATRVLQDGKQNLVVELSTGLHVEVYIARPEHSDLFGVRTPTNFGTLLLCRTGGRLFCSWFAAYARSRGCRWNPYHGLYRAGHLVASATEPDLFNALNLDYIPPKKRSKMSIQPRRVSPAGAFCSRSHVQKSEPRYRR